MTQEEEDILNQATDIVSNNTYCPMAYAYYIIIKEDEDDYREDETGTCETFCENCINDAIIAYKEKYPIEVKGKYVGYRCYSPSEHDDFLLCDGCSEIFAASVLLSDQELDHWEALEDSAINLQEPRILFELDAIFYHSWAYGMQSEFEIKEKQLRVIALAERVIKIYNQQKAPTV